MRNPFTAGRCAVCAWARVTGVSIAGFCLFHALLAPAIAAEADNGPALVPGPSFEIDVIARALDLARGQIQPSLGSTVYQFKRDTIENQPQGYNQSVNQVLL